jgi:uncharacterized protein (TIRG00374 family)
MPMPDNNANKKISSKKLWSFLFFVALNIAIVVYIAFREFGSGSKSAGNLAKLDVNMSYLIFAVGCFAVAVGMETLKYKAMMISAEGRDDLRGAFECAVLGKYYDNITPLGAGGQPFQIIYLKKRGLSTGSSAALPIAGFLFLQFAFVAIAAIVFIFNGKVTQNVAAIRISAYVGLAFYLFVPLCIVLFAFIPRTFGRMVCAAAKFLSRLHIVRDYDKAVGSIFGSLGEYTESLNVMRKCPHLFGKLMLYSVVYQVAIMSIPFFVLRAFGGTNDWWTVFSLVVFIYAAITIIPTPGNSGAAEGSFYAVFSSLTVGYLFWGMLIWRLLVYYSWLMLGLVVMARSAVPSKQSRIKRKLPEGPLRVALFTDLFYPSIDGVVRTVDAYAKRLSRDGGYCCVVCPRGPVPFKDDFPYDVVRTKAVKMPGVSYLFPAPDLTPGLRSFFKGKQFDAFHVHSPFFVGRFAVRMGRKMGVPVIATFHSKFYDDVFNITHSRFCARVVANYVVNFFCSVDVVWACSQGAANTLRSYGFKGEISVMENGVDMAKIDDREVLRQRAVSEFGLQDKGRILLFVGQQIWQKNLRLVLDTMKMLKDSGGGYYAVIAGEGYDSTAIREYTKKIGIEDSVLFTGQISDRALLYGLYSASGLFFFPSDYDTSGLVIREAALVETPSLLHAGSDAAEVVTDGYNGYTEDNDPAKMAAKIQSIFSDPSALAETGKHAKETIPVSWDDIVLRASEQYRIAKKRSYEPVDVRKEKMQIESEGI